MLYLVATPIGNLGDMTLRAIDTLKSVSLILCEDTRHSRILFERYGIKAPLESYEKFSEAKKTGSIVERLKKGEDIALVTDAGMPLVSDPGYVLVSKLIEEGLEYTVVGSSCAAISALVMSGLDTTAFLFAGFLPEKMSQRNAVAEKFSKIPATIVFYVTPHGVEKDLEFLHSAFGRRKACLVREISKIHEEKIMFMLGDDVSSFTLKGEMVLVVEGFSGRTELSSLSVGEHYAAYLSKGLGEKEAMKAVAKDRNVSKSEIYSVLKGKQSEPERGED